MLMLALRDILVGALYVTAQDNVDVTILSLSLYGIPLLECTLFCSTLTGTLECG